MMIGLSIHSDFEASLHHSFEIFDIFQVVGSDRMHIQMIDTKAAYLCQKYPDDATPLYVKLPKRVALALNLNPDQTYRVKRFMYGLPDAGRAYYDAYCEHLTENGFTRAVSYLCYFF